MRRIKKRERKGLVWIGVKPELHKAQGVPRIGTGKTQTSWAHKQRGAICVPGKIKYCCVGLFFFQLSVLQQSHNGAGVNVQT